MTRGILPPPGFSPEGFKIFVEGRDEPDWLRERRRRGWERYQALEAPFWRRTSLRKLKWEELIPYAPSQRPTTELAALPPKLHAALATYGQRAGLLLQRDTAGVYVDLADEIRAQGVIWTDLETAAREHPDLVQSYFQQAVAADADKWTALLTAFWSGGTFLYVPRGVTVERPFVSVLWQELPQLAIFAPTLLIAEAGSRVTLVSELLSMGCDVCPTTYHGGVAELFVGAGAQVHYINAQDLGQQVYDLRRQTALLSRDSRLEWLSIHLGGAVSRAAQHTILREPGAEAQITGLYLPADRQHIAFDTLQDHIAPRCTSDLLYQGALLDHARAVYEGVIRARPGAQQTDAYQSNRNLLLPKGARADSLPQLEIEANDLRCSHGATVSPVDESQVFYLQSRGIPRREAMRLIVEGFFRPSLDRLPESLEGLRGRLTDAIAGKLR